jgi:hypothetical protein
MTLYAIDFTQPSMNLHFAPLPPKTQGANERDTLVAFSKPSPTMDLEFAGELSGGLNNLELITTNYEFFYRRLHWPLLDRNERDLFCVTGAFKH